MKNIFKISLILSIVSLLGTSCAKTSTNNSNSILVHVLNAEDYIDMSLLDSFSSYIYERDGKRVQVVYDTYDTNETMYNTLKTGKTQYDAICASDYMIQKLAREDYLTTFDYDKLPNYRNYVSSFLSSFKNEDGKLNQIKIKDGSSLSLKDYALGYMWGTLGIIYNPDYILKYNSSIIDLDPRFKDLTKEEQKDKLIELFNGNDGYSLFWDPILNKTQSIKDSMRDTYALGIFEVYKDYFLNSEDSYNLRNEKFNSSDQESIELVKNKLIELKDNIFGFEVDSGKNDIVTQKIGVNLAWSGDAVNSINRGYYADDDWTIPSENPVDLYYSIPSIGANVWFDAWALPKQEKEYYSSDTYKYTLEFLDYISHPENALLNQYYNGYTSFIGANNQSETSKLMLAYILYSYDLSDGINDEDLSQYDTYDLTPFFDFDDEFEIDLSYLSENIMEDEEIDDRIFKFNKDENGEVKIIIHTDMEELEGRLLKAQFPEAKDIDSLYVMRDYASQNNAILQMWEDVKVNPLPLWITISLLVIIVLFFSYLGSYKLLRILKLRRRKKLREEL